MRSFRLLPLLVILAACAPKISPQGGHIYLGSSCSDSTPTKLPVMRQASQADSLLDARGLPSLVVIVDSSTTAHRLAAAPVVNLSNNTFRLTDDSGRAQLDKAHAGENRLRVRHIGYASWEGVIRARTGYRDTMELGLGAGVLCFSAANVGATGSLLSGPSGELVVRVLNEAKLPPLTDALVRLQRGPVAVRAQRIDSGLYAFPAVPVGRYLLRILRIGFIAHAESVTVKRDAVDTLERTLKTIKCDLDCDGDIKIIRTMRP